MDTSILVEKINDDLKNTEPKKTILETEVIYKKILVFTDLSNKTLRRLRRDKSETK